jgi:hypothetical protein
MGQTNLTYEYNALKEEIFREQRLLKMLEDDLFEVNTTINSLKVRELSGRKFPVRYGLWADLVLAIEQHTRILRYMTEQDYMTLRPRFKNMLRVLMTL